MKVLIVDDSDVTLKVLRGILTKAGFDVEEATNGKEALDKVMEGHIRLVVSDWEMPVMSGLGLCRAIRTAVLPAYVYVILLTMHGNVEERVAGLSVGADDFISKPFNAEELVARLRAGERVISLPQK